MKLLPYTFKKIGLILFIIGFATSMIDDGRMGFIEGMKSNDYSNKNLSITQRIMPAEVSKVADYFSLLGLLLVLLSNNKKEDEFTQQLRYESGYITLVISTAIILILYIINYELSIEPSAFLACLMILYFIVYRFRKNYFLD